MDDYKALIAEARKNIDLAYGGELAYIGVHVDMIARLADALEATTVERAVVEAHALEQAADTLRSAYLAGGAAMELRERARELRARAVEIREGRQ